MQAKNCTFEQRQCHVPVLLLPVKKILFHHLNIICFTFCLLPNILFNDFCVYSIPVFFIENLHVFTCTNYFVACIHFYLSVLFDQYTSSFKRILNICFEYVVIVLSVCVYSVYQVLRWIINIFTTMDVFWD